MRSGRRCLLVPLLVLGFLAPTQGAAARQLDAFQAPQVSGPLLLGSRDCGRRTTRNDAGVVVARAKSCIRFYFFDPRQEASVSRDYGVIWLQTNVNARPRWCTTSVRSEIRLPRGVRAHERRPTTKRAATRRPTRTLLLVDAEESALRAASIKRRYVMYTGRLVGRRASRGFRAVWRGSSTRKLAFPLGVEISWRAADGPPRLVSSRLGYNVRLRPNC